MTILASLLNQIEILFIGVTLLHVRKLITKENFDDLYEHMFGNRYFTIFLIALWFGIIPIMAHCFRWEPFGIWGSLYRQSSSCFWIVLGVIAVFNSYMLYRVRRQEKVD